MIEFVFDFPGKEGLLLVTAALSVIIIANHCYTRWHLDGIEVVGEDWRRFASEFERPYSFKATLKSLKSIGERYLPK